MTQESEPIVIVEWLTYSNYQAYLAELQDENAEVAAIMSTWIEPHAQHSKLALRWIKFDPARWHIHGFCGLCGVCSAEYFVGDDTIFPIVDGG